MPPDDELAEFLRAVLPDQEPPLPRHFVTEARVSGQRIKARRRLRMGVTTIALCAVLVGAGTAVWVADRADRQASPMARPDNPVDPVAIARLAVAVQRNLTQHARENSSDMVVMPPVFKIGPGSPVWRIELAGSGARAGWIDIATDNVDAATNVWQMRCPIRAFDTRESNSALCGLPSLTPGAGPGHPSGPLPGEEPVEVLVIEGGDGRFVMLTAHWGSAPGGASATPQRPGDVGETDKPDKANNVESVDDTEQAGRLDRTDPSGPMAAAPMSALEMSEILRRGDAPAALTALLGIGI